MTKIGELSILTRSDVRLGKMSLLKYARLKATALNVFLFPAALIMTVPESQFGVHGV